MHEAPTWGQNDDVEAEEGVDEEGVHAIEDGAFESGDHNTGYRGLHRGVEGEHRGTRLTALWCQRDHKVHRQVGLSARRQ